MKYKYSIDNNNQLLIKPPKEKVSRPVRGRFSVDKNNRLVYWLNEPTNWRRIYNLPSKITFTGNWQLNPNYDLGLNLDKTKNQYGAERLTLKGEIISCDRDALAFEVASQDKQGLLHIQLLKLTGSWQADEFSRITFTVKKKTSPDTIILENAWQINKNQQIIYTYEKTNLITKSKTFHVLAFEGFWEINSSNRLTYILSRSLESCFDLRVQIESPNLYPKEGVIKYRLGIGLRKERLSRMETVCLYGTWKFNRRAGLVFQMDYGKGRLQGIEFGANVYLNKKDELVFSLTDKQKEPLGFNIIFNHKFLKDRDAQAFLRLKNIINRKEAAIEAGVRIPF